MGYLPMWNGRTVSVVLGTYAEKDSIYEVIQGYFDTGVVDESPECLLHDLVAEPIARQGHEEGRCVRSRLQLLPQLGEPGERRCGARVQRDQAGLAELRLPD